MAMTAGATLTLRDNMSAKLDRARGTARRFVDDIHSGVSKLDRFTGSLAKAGTGIINWFGAKASKIVSNFFMSLKISALIGTAALSAFVVKAVNDAAKFQETIRNSTALLVGAGASSEQADATFQIFSKGILEMAPRVAKGPEDLSNAMYDIVSAGFADADALQVLEVAGKGASAGFTDTKTAVKGLVGTLRAYGMEADSAKRVMDVMFQSVNVGQLTFEEFAQNIGDVVGIAATAKIPIEEIGGAIAQMTKRGVVPAEAFTSLNRFILSIVSPSPQVAEAAATLGLTEEKWGAQALALNGITGAVDELMKILKPSAEDLKALESSSSDVVDNAVARIAGDKIEVLTNLFGDVRGLRGALILAATDGYTFSQAMNDMVGSAGSVDRAFEEQEKSANRARDRLMAYFDVLKLQIASDVLPALADKFKEIGGWIQREIIDNPEYQNLQGLDKLKFIGEKIWNITVDWWRDHKDEVTQKIGDFFDWFGKTAVPFVAKWGFDIGKELVPAIFKGITSTPEGNILLAIFGGNALSKMIPGMGAGAGAGVGAGGAAAGGLLTGGALGKIAQVTLSGAIVYFSAQAVYQQWSNTSGEVAEGSKGLAATTNAAADSGNLRGLAAGYAAANPTQSMLEDMRDSVSDALFGSDDARTVIDKGIFRYVDNRLNAAVKSLDSEDPTKVVHDMESAGLWQVLDDTMKNEIQRRINVAGVAIQRDTAVEQAKNLYTAGVKQIGDLDLSKAKTTAEAFDQITAAFQSGSSFEWENFDPNTNAQPIKTLMEDTGKLYNEITTNRDVFKQNATDYRRMADELKITNPLMSGFYTMLAGIAEKLAGILGVTEGNVAGNGVSGFEGWHLGPGADGSEIWIQDDPLNKPGGANNPINRRTGKMAKGGYGTVTSPQWFLAGDAGAEDFAFIPHAAGGLAGLGGSGGVTVQGPLIGQATIREEADIEKVAARLADELEKRRSNSTTVPEKVGKS